MIAIDTNVLLRLLHDDGSSQVAVARTRIAQAAEAGQPLFIAQICLCETVWVLMRHYGFPRERVALAVAAMLDNPAFAFEAEAEVRAALDLFRHGRADFADGLIVIQAQLAGCAGTLSFDQAMASLPGVEVLS
jgi:Predicted nucleic-acid-binding protein, contains PIN domain